MNRAAILGLYALLAGAVPARAAVDAPAPPPDSAWTRAVHGYAFLTSNRQGGPSGGRVFESVNHLMVRASRGLGGGTLSLLGTFTIEPATIRSEGSPELFQRGETYAGRLLVDRQHPHDLLVQLAARWERPLTGTSGWFLYLAPHGEPAVGPTAYPHRMSASENPMAPLAHHNQDSTHLSAGVATLGYRAGPILVEGSAFHGREPDENRWDLEHGAPDSYAGRVTVRAGGGFTVQLSGARREEPEELEEGNQTRQTLSVEYARSMRNGYLAAALILGRNLIPGATEWGNGIEATWKFRGRNFVYGRVESVDRDLYELVNKDLRPDGAPSRRLAMQAATFGCVRDVPLLTGIDTGLGAGVTLYRYDAVLDPVYGDRPVSLAVFMRLRTRAPGGSGHHH